MAPDQLSDLLNEMIVEVVVGFASYSLGFLTSHAIHTARKASFEKKFHSKAKLAIDLIYESERRFPGRKKGVEKLEYAAKKFSQIYKDMDYEASQDFIIKMFSLTNLSK